MRSRYATAQRRPGSPAGSRTGVPGTRRSLSIRYDEDISPHECEARRRFGGFSRIFQAPATGGGISNESDVQRQKQYVKVLREVTSGDTLGPPENHPTSQAVRRFELSGNLFASALIDQMIAGSLLNPDGERGVIITAEGERYFTRHR